MKKEKKQSRYPGMKAGSIYGTVIFFIIPLIDTYCRLTSYCKS